VADSLLSRENGLLAEGLDAYPNLKAIIEGRIAGNFREWPAVRGELERLLMDQAELMRKASDALQSYRLASSETREPEQPKRSTRDHAIEQFIRTIAGTAFSRDDLRAEAKHILNAQGVYAFGEGPMDAHRQKVD
jgi:predicted phage gp36 major capsid-like protein